MEVIDEEDLKDNPLLIEAKKRFESEKQQILEKIPEKIKKDFRKIGFTKWGKQMLPVIELSPFDVEPGGVRDQWISMFENCLKTKRNPSRLIMWYGTIWENRSEAYSFVAKTKITSIETGKAKGYDKLPKVLHKKMTDGKELTEKENFHIQGLDQMQKDLELPPEKRIEWMSRFSEDYDSFLLQDDEDVATNSPPEKPKRKLSKVGRKKKQVKEIEKDSEINHDEKEKVEMTEKFDINEEDLEKLNDRESKHKKKIKKKAKVEVEFTKEAESEFMRSTLDHDHNEKSENDDSYKERDDTDISYDEEESKEKSKVKKKKRKICSENQRKKVGKRKKPTEGKPVKSKKKRKIDDEASLTDEEMLIEEKPEQEMSAETLFKLEQEKFEKCEKVINPILKKISEALEKKDNSGVIGSLDLMEKHSLLLTKSYIEHADMGPLMKKLKKTFKPLSPKVFRKCKSCTNKLRELYNRGSTPPGFIPKPKCKLLHQSIVKQEITQSSVRDTDSPIPLRENGTHQRVSVDETISKKIPCETGQISPKQTKTPEPQVSQLEPKRKKFSLLGLIEGPKKVETIKSNQMRERKKSNTLISPTPVRKQIPKWLTEKPESFDIPLSDDHRIFGLNFLEDAMLSFPTVINRAYAARALEEAIKQWSIETDRFKKFRSDIYWGKVHDICAVLTGVKAGSVLVKAIMDGEFMDAMAVAKLTRKHCIIHFANDHFRSTG